MSHSIRINNQSKENNNRSKSLFLLYKFIYNYKQFINNYSFIRVAILSTKKIRVSIYKHV